MEDVPCRQEKQAYGKQAQPYGRQTQPMWQTGTVTR